MSLGQRMDDVLKTECGIRNGIGRTLVGTRAFWVLIIRSMLKRSKNLLMVNFEWDRRMSNSEMDRVDYWSRFFKEMKSFMFKFRYRLEDDTSDVELSVSNKSIRCGLSYIWWMKVRVCRSIWKN
jgi:hypothetical protein